MTFEEITAEDFRAFADKSPYKSFMQTPEIAQYREDNGWTVYYLAAKNGGEIKAATMAVARPNFLGKSVFITPGGPLLDLEDEPLTTYFMKNLKRYMRAHNGYLLRISPYYELIERDRNGGMKEGGFNHQGALKNLRNLGFLPLESPDQPQYMFAMDLNGRTPEQLMKDFKRNTRNHVKKAEKMGVKVRELKREELGIFKEITKSTSERRHFTDKPLAYYEQMYDLFAPRGEVKFLVAEVETIVGAEISVDPEPSAKGAENGVFGDLRYNRGENGEGVRVGATCAEGHKDLARAARSVPEGHAAPALAPLCLSAAMFMLYGDEVVYLFSGSDEKYMRDYNAQYAIQWHMLKWAAEHGYKRYNFYGIGTLPDPSSENYGIYDFKKGFGGDYGQVLEYIGTFELPLDQKFYQLHRILSKLKHH